MKSLKVKPFGFGSWGGVTLPLIFRPIHLRPRLVAAVHATKEVLVIAGLVECSDRSGLLVGAIPGKVALSPSLVARPRVHCHTWLGTLGAQMLDGTAIDTSRWSR